MIDFTLERGRHARFVGREDVLAQLDQWLLGPDTGWVVITGGPGMGKSAVLSRWLARREEAGAVVPHHFVRRQVANWDQPEAIAASLAAQIEARFPEQRDPEARPEGRLIELFARVSKHLGEAERLVVLVDGLDETRAAPGDNPLPRFLPHVVPAGIRLLCAMRPTYPHLHWIEARSPARRIDLDDRRWAASNEAVVRGFWQAVAAEYDPPLPAGTVATAIEHAEGNVLHAVMLHGTLRDSTASERRADRIPRGLSGLIGEIWDRAAAHEGVRTGLGLLCAAQEALSLDVIGDLIGWGTDDYEERRRFVPEARQLLLEEPASWSGTEAYRPRHDWVRELMAERLGAATIRAHHGTLAQKLATWPAPAEPMARRYALRHALLHRVEASAWEDAWRIASDTRFLEAKCRELGAHEAEADVARAAERCRANGAETLHERFRDLARALGRDSHWLRAAPEATAALVWNRLRQLGWRADDIDQHLQLPAESAFLRVRHVITRESPALVRDLTGHTLRVTACAVTPDGRRVVSASYDKTLKVWDLDSGRELATLHGHAHEVTACAVTPDGRRAVSASWDKTLKVWDLDSGHELLTLHGHAREVTACAVTPDGQRVVSASWDKTLKVWDLDSGSELATLRGHASFVNACAVTPDGKRVVSPSYDKTLKIWDLNSGSELATPHGHAGRVRACAVTPDGRRVVSASTDQTLKVWDLDSGHELATLHGHAGRVRACAVTPDGRRVVSASTDQTLKVWDLNSHTCLFTHHASTSFASVAATATTIIAGDRTGSIWLLDVPSRDRGGSNRDACRPEVQPTSFPHTQLSSPRPSAPTQVDIGILTIRDDEFRAVLGAFPDKAGIRKGKTREYTLRHADASHGERYTVAILRLVEQGNGEAQDAARDLIDDLAPKLVLVVGIAGALPSDDVKLGDVVLATRIHDFTVETRSAGQPPAYATRGGAIDKPLAAAVANLAAREDELGAWTDGLPAQPPVSWTPKGQLYGPIEWQSELRAKLEHHYPKRATPRAPVYVAGPIASSDRLVKDPELLFPWLTTVHDILAVEMESGGVYRAVREQCPMLAIRGISDIVGLKRADAWTKFACASAAAFTRAFLRTRPVSVGAPAGVVAAPSAIPHPRR